MAVTLGCTVVAVVVMTWILQTHGSALAKTQDQPRFSQRIKGAGLTCTCGSTSSPVCDGQCMMTDGNCVSQRLCLLLIQSKGLDSRKLPGFVQNLHDVVSSLNKKIQQSPPNIVVVVETLKVIANVSIMVSAPVMENVLKIVDFLAAEEAVDSWATLRKHSNANSDLLGVLEDLSEVLEDTEFSITTPWIQLKKNTFNQSFEAQLNPRVSIKIPPTNLSNAFITTITFSTLDNVLPSEINFYGITFNTTINADTLLMKVSRLLNEDVTLSFKKIDKDNSRYVKYFCVHWEFSLFSGLRGWYYGGCDTTFKENDIVTCHCRYFSTSFIALKYSLYTPDYFYKDWFFYVKIILNFVCIFICLIIEGCVWKSVTTNSTALMRHVAIINSAMSLFIADCCLSFQLTTYINSNTPTNQCSTLVFFWHFFDMSLFFWMLVSCLLLFYRTSMVFSDMSRSKILAVGFGLGYGAPLLIAIVTVASTAPRGTYIYGPGYCLLNWERSKALLALGIPVLIIVLINVIILILVVIKIIRSRRTIATEQTDDRSVLVVRLVFLLMSFILFGLTRGLGLGTIYFTYIQWNYFNKFYVAYKVFSALQGFWIVIFGPLYDSKIRSIIYTKCCRRSANVEQHEID